MFHSSRPIRPVPVRSAAECMCHDGGRCTSYDPGHALHLIQARLAAATPSEWTDGIVVATDPERGTVTVRGWDDAVETVYANSAGAADAASVGTPVAVHARYRVLAVGRSRFNVRETA
ncbi:hypothetical protein [Microbacterium sp. GXF7504]